MVELDEEDEEEKQRETAAMGDASFPLQGMSGAAGYESYGNQETQDGDNEDDYEDDFEVKLFKFV